jgi:hypothetical protein
MKVKVAMITLMFGLTLSACAPANNQKSTSTMNRQESAPSMNRQGGNIDFSEIQPLFELMNYVEQMVKVDAASGLAYDRTQAANLLPILKELADRTDLKGSEASQVITILKESLTPKQRQWVGERLPKLSADGPPPGASQGAPPPGFMEMAQAIQAGKPYNPFQPRGPGATNLAALVKLLQQR